jgi:hypothetical protein
MTAIEGRRCLMARSDKLREAPTAETGGPEDPRVEERTAHAWELGPAESWVAAEAEDSWEPVVPDTWAVPADADQSPEVAGLDTEAPDAAAWSDAARTEAEWSEAAWGEGGRRVAAGWAEADREEARWASTAGGGEAVPQRTDGTARVPYPAAVGAVSDEGDRPMTGRAPDQASSPARMALGLATLAAQRLRGGVPVGDGFVTGVGLVQQTANGLRELSRRALAPASRLAAGTVGAAAALPVVGFGVRAALRARLRLAATVEQARALGHDTVAAGRADAERALRDGVERTRRLAEQVVPRLVSAPTDRRR